LKRKVRENSRFYVELYRIKSNLTMLHDL